MTLSSADSFPRRSARTLRFTAGAPRAFQLSPDGTAVTFLRSSSGTDRAASLRILDADTGTERLVADPAALLSGGDENLSQEERSRRERMREGGAGITGYACDAKHTVAAFALSSRLFVADLSGTGARELPAAGAVLDPRPSPDGTLVAYAAGGGLHVVAVDAGAVAVDAGSARGRVLAEPDGPEVTYGLAEFVASEELERYRGFWWSPASDALLVARVDNAPVQVWHIADPEQPSREPLAHRYPAAGTPNAEVTLWLIGLDGSRTQVHWDHETFPYLVAVSWGDNGPALLQVFSRRQDRAAVLSVDGATGASTVVREQSDPCWVDVVPGTPAWTAGGALVTVEVVGEALRLCLDGSPVSPTDVQVRAVQTSGAEVYATATSGLGEQHLYRFGGADGFAAVSTTAGVHSGLGGNGTALLASSTLDSNRTTYTVRRGDRTHVVLSQADDPGLLPVPRLLRVGSRVLPTAVLLPQGWLAGGEPLPVLLDPYGGPHHANVWSSARAFLESQWWADQGYAVVVCDNRGTPGTPSFERSVRLDLTSAPVDDQVEALHAVAEAMPGVLDLSRVAIRGWSFGGYLAALAVLSRPDVFHAAVAGAPVTDWRLYDTAYTERYLGLPDEHPEAYDHGSLMRLAPGLARPLLIIHGLADDNVVAAHSLRLSSALLAAGRPHTFLPLSGVTHMTPQEVVAENLLLIQRDFLAKALAS